VFSLLMASSAALRGRTRLSLPMAKTGFLSQVLKVVKDAGYEVSRRSKNSHYVCYRPGSAVIILPQKIEDRGLAKDLIKRATNG